MVSDRIEVFGASENVQTLRDINKLDRRAGRLANLNECIVQNEHDSRGIPHPLLTPEKHLANITYVSDFRVAETKFPAYW